MTNPSVGRLYVVATPIGNLGDLSPRALEALRGADLIAAEDTRHTGHLLAHFAVSATLVSLHEHSGEARVHELTERLSRGARVALVSDAGTPAISDPGFALVRAALDAGVEVHAVPGPCAAIAALSIAGLPTDRFCFEGFLPQRPAARRARLAALKDEERTLVFYEAPHRIAQMLADCAHAFGAARPAAVAREITKMHETLYRGTLEQLGGRAQTERDFERGELVVVVAGAPPREAAAEERELSRVLEVLLADLPLKQAALLAARLTGARDNAAYRRALELQRPRNP